MQARRRSGPPTCRVIIRLQKADNLEITTTASHALEILDGETIIPATQASVTDLEGQPLSRDQLLALKAQESR